MKYWNEIFNLSTVALIGQIFFLLLIIGGLYYFFKNKEGRKINTVNLIQTAIFVVIPLVLSIYLSFYIPLAGVNAFKIGFAQPVMAAGGVILNSSLGFIAGIIIDILGIILMPSGVPYFGFTFNAAMVFVIGYLVFKYTIHYSDKKIRNLIYSIYGIGFLLFSILILTIKTIRLESLAIRLDEIVFFIPNRYLLILIVFVVISILVIITRYTIQFLKNENQGDIYRFILISLLIEFGINVLLTSMHIHVLYSIPLITLIVPRIIKALLFLPVNTAISYFVYKIAKKIKR